MSISEFTTSSVRAPHNGHAWSDLQRRILRTVAQDGPQSRADLARALGVMRSTVGEPVHVLLQEGTLREHESVVQDVAVTRAGRPGTRLELDPLFCSFVGVEVGIGRVHVVRTDFQNCVVARAHRDIAPDDLSPAMACQAVCDLIETLGDAPLGADGIMVSIPGIVDRSGTVRRVLPIGWQNVPFAGMLTRALDYPDIIPLENDANVFSEAYLAHVGADRIQNALFVWLDEGIGGAVVANGQPAFGSDGFGGEIGHITVSPSPDARRNRLENIAGRAALLRRNAELGGTACDITRLLQHRAGGQMAATRALDEWVGAMADGLANLTSVLNPSDIVFGGPLIPVLSKELARLRDTYLGCLMPGTPAPTWHLAQTDADHIALGCCVLLRNQMFRGPLT